MKKRSNIKWIIVLIVLTILVTAVVIAIDFYTINLGDLFSKNFNNQVSNSQSALTKVEDIGVYPYLQTCKVYTKDGLTQDSAFLIAPNIALTCAHCVFDKDTGDVIQGWTMYPGYNDGSYNNVQTGWSVVHYSPMWLKTKDSKYDWAILELNNPIGNDVGWITFVKYSNDNTLKNIGIKVLGYPADSNYRFYWKIPI